VSSQESTDAMTSANFMKILRKFGIPDEDPRFAEILKFFRDLRGGKV
jgi:EF-hand domain